MKYITEYNIWIIVLIIVGAIDEMCKKNGFSEVHNFLCIIMSFFGWVSILFQIVYIIKCRKNNPEIRNKKLVFISCLFGLFGAIILWCLFM